MRGGRLVEAGLLALLGLDCDRQVFTLHHHDLVADGGSRSVLEIAPAMSMIQNLVDARKQNEAVLRSGLRAVGKCCDARKSTYNLFMNAPLSRF